MLLLKHESPCRMKNANGWCYRYSVNVMGFMCFLFVVSGIVGVQMFKGLGSRRCEYGGFHLMAELGEDKFAFQVNSPGTAVPGFQNELIE